MRFVLPDSRVATMLLVIGLPTMGTAQTDRGSTAAALLGGAMGAYSGIALGMLGGTVPCSQTLRSVRCIQLSAATGAAVAAVSGAFLGDADRDRVEHVAVNAAIGAGIGMAAGLGLSQFTQRVGPRDVVALALAGGAVGTVPRGAGIGFGIGGAAGLLLMGLTDFNLPDAIGAAMLGLAIGGLTQWILDANHARDETAEPDLAIVAYRISF